MRGPQAELLYQVAQRHYVEGATMDAIAAELGVSRPTVSRLLAKARNTGLVRITIAEPPGSQSPTAVAIAERFGIQVHIVNVVDSVSPTTRINMVAKLAAKILTSLVKDESSLGVAWGVTAARVARQLDPVKVHGVRVVQMNGSAHAYEAALPYAGSLLQMYAQAYGNATIVPFPVPAFFDHAGTKEAMWRERSVLRVLNEIRRLDVAVFGVGYPNARVPSHVYANGYIDPGDLSNAIADGAVGDICTVLIRADGSFRGIALNDRASGPTPEEMQSIGRRLCVVGDPSRSAVLLAALRARAVTDLVCDNVTARTLHRMIESTE